MSNLIPDRCPVCGELLVWKGVDLKCNNSQCKNLDSSNLQVWCENIGETDGLQYTIMKQYLDKYGVTNLDDLYRNQGFILNDLRARKLSITESKILEFFHKLFECDVPADKALIALNIPRLGDKTAEILMGEAQLVYDIYEFAQLYKAQKSLSIPADLYNRLCSVVKEATTASIFDNLDKIYNLKYLCKGDKLGLIFSMKDNNVTKYVAVTGALKTMKRKDFEKFIAEYGYELSSNLKKCEYLITNNPASGSTKNNQALKYGITTITEREFLNELNR